VWCCWLGCFDFGFQFSALSNDSYCCVWSCVHMASICFLCWISCLLLCHVGASALQLSGAPGEEGLRSHGFIQAVLVHVRGFAVGSNVRAANAQVAVGSVGGRCAKQSVLIQISSAKVEASQNRGRSDFQKSYTETLTAKEMGAIVESARAPRIVLARLCPSVLVNPAVSKVMFPTRCCMRCCFNRFPHR